MAESIRDFFFPEGTDGAPPPARDADAGGGGVVDDGVDGDDAITEDDEFFRDLKQVDDLVSRATAQWAISESQKASAAADASPTPPRTRPARRPAARKPPGDGGSPRDVAAGGGGGGGKVGIPPARSSPSSSSPAPSPGAVAQMSMARAQVDARRAKLAVVETLLEAEAPDAARLASMTRGWTGEEFLAIAEERCLAGRCGWPLCGVDLKAAARTAASDDDARTAKEEEEEEEESPAGTEGKRRGKYRIDARNRRVYLRCDVEMFCGEAHRVAAEDYGVSLAIDLEKDAGGGSDDDDEDNDKDNDDDDDDENEMIGGNEEEAKRNAKVNEAKNTRREAIENVNENVKMAVVERSTTGRNPCPPKPPTAFGDALAAAYSVEGYTSAKMDAAKKKLAEAPAAKGVLKSSSGLKGGWLGKSATSKKEADAGKGVKFDRSIVTGPTGSDFADVSEEERAAIAADTEATAAEARRREAAKEDAAKDAAKSKIGKTAEETEPKFFFDIYGEGGAESREKKSDTIMGMYSEGQISRVTEMTGDDVGEIVSDDDEAAASDAMTDAFDAANAAAAAAAAFEKSGDEAAAEKALAKARQALRAAITVAAGDDDDDGATTDGESSADGGGTPAPPVSEFGQTWMMLDGWVTRATFHYLSGGRDGAMIRTAGTTGGEDGTSTTDADGDEDPVLGPDLPPRSPFEAAASKAAGAELSRALPVACRMLKLRSSSTALERPLGRLLRTFFFQGAVPALKPARWTLVCAVLLEAIGTRRLAEGERDDRPPSLAEDFAREVRSIHWSPYDRVGVVNADP